MSWGEALRLTGVLLSDPSSMVTARLSEWEHPVSRETAVLMELLDLTNLAHTDPKKRSLVKPYPRPWPSGKRRGRTKRSRAEVVAILNDHGHTLSQ